MFFFLPKVLYLPQAKQNLAAGVLAEHQHRHQQRLHPLQDVWRLHRQTLQPSAVRRETGPRAAGYRRLLLHTVRRRKRRRGRGKNTKPTRQFNTEYWRYYWSSAKPLLLFLSFCLWYCNISLNTLLHIIESYKVWESSPPSSSTSHTHTLRKIKKKVQLTRIDHKMLPLLLFSCLIKEWNVWSYDVAIVWKTLHFHVVWYFHYAKKKKKLHTDTHRTS